MPYTYLSAIYDRMTDDIDYTNWTNYMLNLAKTDDSVHHILELGCGTGSITLELLKKGYQVVAMDRSLEMLEIAMAKTAAYKDRVILLEQDITEMDFDIYEIDMVMAANDTINYVLWEDELATLFQEVYQRLRKGGSFVFDISSPYKLKHILGSNTFGESTEDSCFMWENYYESEENMLSMDINIFTKNEQGTYHRQTENHLQRAHEPETIMHLLIDAGFKNILTRGDFSMEETKLDQAERIFFCCQK